MRTILGGLAAAAMIGGCSAPARVPDAVPPMLQRPAEYAWGDPVAARDDRLARHVTRALSADHGQASELHLIAPDGAAIEQSRSWYRSQLGQGWAPLPLESVLEPGEAGYGFANGRAAIVVAWLPAQPDGRHPVTVFRFDG